MKRKKARDLYDIYFLIKKNVKLDSLLVSEKMKLCERTYDSEEAEKRVKMFRTQWEKEIPALVLNPPPYDLVASEVSEFFLSQ
ncbi:MAG: nucleotidyl transferase AbiEii/AbiGii toxin family protein [Thermoplasmata archaeon]